MGVLAARRSKAHKQSRLVEKNVCFISDAGKWGAGGRHLSQGWLPHPDKQGWEVSQSWGEVTCRTAPPSLTVIFSWHQWSAQHHLADLGRVHLQFRGTLVPSSLGSRIAVSLFYLNSTWTLTPGLYSIFISSSDHVRVSGFYRIYYFPRKAITYYHKWCGLKQ